MKLSCLLTQYKRNHLEDQLNSVYSQTLKPEYIIVFQNENHVDISPLKQKYDFIHVKSDYNTKHFGRFTYCINLPVDYCIIMDDDILPGIKCFDNYLNQVIELDSIIGGNGRFLSYRKDKPFINDFGIRNRVEVDYIGHLWCFKKKWLYNMFSIEPHTLETSEDMHFCFSNKVREGIKSYVAEQLQIDESADLKMNGWATDQYSSYRTSSHSLRTGVENYFINKYNLSTV